MLLHKKLENYNLILASASPRRRQLLADCGIQFTLAEKFECDETFPATMPCCEVAQHISALKSNAYPNPLSEKDILLTADTVVIAENKILGKPADRAEAVEMLTLLSGRKHTVITGVTIRTASLSGVLVDYSTASEQPLTSPSQPAYLNKQLSPPVLKSPSTMFLASFISLFHVGISDR